MKYIYFVRHGKSSWADFSLADIDRPLNERGKNDVDIMSNALKEKELTPDIIICSPSKRTRLTAKGIMKNLGLSNNIMEVDQMMYHAMYYEVLDIIRKLDNKFDKVMLFGHNPSITNFANKFSKEYINNVPTLGVIKIKCNIEEWKNLTQRNSELEDFFYPKMYK